MKKQIHVPKVILSALFGVSLADIAGAQILSIPIYDHYSNANLYIVAKGNWYQAQSEAQSLGGNLITIQSQAEDTFIVNNVLQDFTSSGGPNLSDLPLWLGLYDPTGASIPDGPGGSGSRHAADFVWANGSSSAYRDWNTATGEPNNADSEIENYAVINWFYALGPGNSDYGSSSTWNDVPLGGTTGYGGTSDGPYYGIAEVAVPESSSWGLLAGGMILLCAVGGKRLKAA